MNLSKEEFSSFGFLSWLFYIISYNSSVVNFLGCQANTASERLANIGKKVGIEAHSRSQGLIDMAEPCATILRAVEGGVFEFPAIAANKALWIQEAIESQILGAVATLEQKVALTDLLTIINNWEKATGHRIKNPEAAGITGTVKVQQNGVGAAALALN